MNALDPRLTCRLEVLPGDHVLDRVTAAQHYGFDGIAFPGRFLDRYLPELRECLADLPLPICSLSLGFEGSLVSPLESERQRCRDSLLTLFDLCAELGIASFNMPPILIEDNEVRMNLDLSGGKDSVTAQDELLLSQLPALGDACQQRQMLLLIEPVNRFETEYLTTVGHAARLCGETNHPAIGCTIDFFHMQMEELNVPEAIEAGGKWIRHVHVAENTRVEPGPGSMNFQPGFAALKNISYTGLIEVECRDLTGPAEQVLPPCVQYLRREWVRAEPSK